MSHHLSRAELLLAQSRPADAEREVRMALGEAPGDPFALAVLARALVAQKKPREALDPARAAVAAAPDLAYVHHILAHVHLTLDDAKAALASANTAVSLDPDDGDLLAQRGSIHLARRDWRAALADAEDALRIQAENTFALNVRAVALRQLGRADEAAAAGAGILERAPEDALSHCTQGWTLLQRGDSRGALTHFREALRLEPDYESARQGMLEALKARNPVYRGMLAYFLWMGRQSSTIQWVFFFVTFFGQRFARRLADQDPTLGTIVWPLLIAFYVFVYLSWTSVPMFNLLLRVNRFGRLVLSRRERIASTWFGLSLLPIVAAAVLWARGDSNWFLFAVTAVLSVCVAITVTREQTRSRWIMGAATLGLAACAVGMFTSGNPGLFSVFAFGFLGMQLSVGFLK